MKKLQVLCVVLLGVSFLSASTPKNRSTDSVDWSKAEERYRTNLKSDNNGVITSTANYIRKYNLTGTIEELKALLANENSGEVKMSAALTLVKIGGNEGRNAVENALKQEESEIVVEFYRSVLNGNSAAQN